jgi:hypothetical protein
MKLKKKLTEQIFNEKKKKEVLDLKHTALVE